MVSAQQSLAAHQHSYQNQNKEQLPPNQSKLASKEKALQMYTKSMQTLEKLKTTYAQKNSSLLAKSQHLSHIRDSKPARDPESRSCSVGALRNSNPLKLDFKRISEKPIPSVQNQINQNLQNAKIQNS